MSITPYQDFHEKNLGFLIFAFLSKEDRKNLGLVDKAWRKAKLEFEVQGYKVLKDKMRKREFIYITDEKGLHQETLLGVLGQGGSKKAIKLSNGRALVLPNMDEDPIVVVIGRWKRMVHEEIAMSKVLSKIGILSPLSQRVSISLSKDSREGTIPAYLSETFENLGKTKGWFIIDTKNPESSTWKRKEHFLFNSEEDRLKEQNWDSVVDPVLTDIARICMYGIPSGGDSLNIAIVKNPSKSAISQYKIRYFGFDFSSKHYYLSIPKIQEKPSHIPNIDWATRLLDSILDHVFFSEFGRRYDKAEGEELRSLKDQLVKKHRIAIDARMQELLLSIMPENLTS